MSYSSAHETSDLRTYACKGGARGPGGRVALLRCLRREGVGGFTPDAPPQPQELRQTKQPVDLTDGRRGQLRGGHNTEAGQRRDHPGNAGKAWRALGAGQTLDGEPRSAVRPQKGARDRLIRLARSHPEWALGFEDESWFSRFERPSLRSWTDVAKPPMRLLQKEPTKDDPEPKALSCYGLYLPELEETWLRFVDGRPVSDITARFLGWC